MCIRDRNKNNQEHINVNTTELSSDNHSSEEDVSVMRRAMQELSIDHRNILSLFYLEGYTVIEIAAILDTSKGTVKSRLFYARESLKKQIKNYNHE